MIVSDIRDSKLKYRDFQQFTLEEREEAFKWLNGDVNHLSIIRRLLRQSHAANDNFLAGSRTIIAYHEYVMMLYCWIENGCDDVRTKLAYIEGRSYGTE